MVCERDNLAIMGRFHRYSWGNALPIFWQRPTATHVAGFHAWLRLRRYVRKGEKGIVILAPLVGRIRRQDDSDELVEAPCTKVFVSRADPPSTVKTEADWVRAGVLVFDAPIRYRSLSTTDVLFADEEGE